MLRNVLFLEIGLHTLMNNANNDGACAFVTIIWTDPFTMTFFVLSVIYIKEIKKKKNIYFDVDARMR